MEPGWSRDAACEQSGFCVPNSEPHPSPRTHPRARPDAGDTAPAAQRAEQAAAVQDKAKPTRPFKTQADFKGFTLSPLLIGSKIPRDCYLLNQEHAFPPCLPRWGSA